MFAYVVGNFLAPVSNSSAVTCEDGTVSGTTDICGTDNTDVNVSIEGSWTVSISSAGTLGVNITPTSSGVVNTAIDNVNIYTNTPNGYQLYLNSTSGSTDIYNNSDTQQERNHFTATTGTKASPVSLTSNSWGYSLASSPTTFSKVEASSSASDSLITSGPKTTGSGDDIDVTYGFNADTKLTPGTYTTSVTYTAVAEVPSYTISSISPNQLYTNDQSNKQVTILTTTPSTELGLGDITTKITNAASTAEETNTNTAILTNCTEIISGGYRGATCTFNGSLVYGTYNVILTSSWHASTYTLVDGFNMRDHRTMSNITYMQEMNPDICANTPETTSLSNAITLTDSRGKGNAGSQTGSYRVIKAKDDNCWMIDNLNLYNKSIAAADSDFTSPSSYTIPNGITSTSEWSSNIYNAKRVEVAHGLGYYADKTDQYGTYGTVYYNWTVAVAKETTEGVTTAPDTSICPKGWTLPTNGDRGVNKSWAKLLDVYGVTTGAQLLTKPLGFTKYYGFWSRDVASEYLQGVNGYFWSGTPSSESSAYDLVYNSGGVIPQQNSGKGYGFSIRCVAR